MPLVPSHLMHPAMKIPFCLQGERNACEDLLDETGRAVSSGEMELLVLMHHEDGGKQLRSSKNGR